MKAHDHELRPPVVTAQAGFADDVLLILAELERTEADALRLIYFRGLTYDQTARALGMSRADVSRCVAAGMRTLAGRLSRTT